MIFQCSETGRRSDADFVDAYGSFTGRRDKKNGYSKSRLVPPPGNLRRNLCDGISCGVRLLHLTRCRVFLDPLPRAFFVRWE